MKKIIRVLQDCLSCATARSFAQMAKGVHGEGSGAKLVADSVLQERLEKAGSRSVSCVRAYAEVTDAENDQEMAETAA